MNSMILRESFWQMLVNSVGDSANRKAPAVPPPAPPTSTAPIRAGVYVRPWTESAATLATLGDLRAGVVRINYPAWPVLVRNGAPFDPAEAARLLNACEAQIYAAVAIGARPLIVTTLATTAPASEADVVRDAPLVAAWYATLAQRWPTAAFEIGNEQEIQSGGGDAPLSADAYARVFTIHATAIHKANLGAICVTAGTSGFTRPQWLREVLAKCSPDAVGIHPYGTAPQDYAARVREIGTSLPVWFTEFGITDLRTQADTLNRYMAYSRGVVPVAVWFALSDLSADNGETFGLMDRDGNKRASYDAAKATFSR